MVPRPNPKAMRFSIALKFVSALTVTVGLFGLVHITLLRDTVSPVLQDVAQKRSHELCRQIASTLIEPMLVDDTLEILRVVDQSVASRSARYAYVVNEQGEVVVHSFADQVPSDLLIYAPPHDRETSRLIDIRGRFVRDISVPLAGGRLGALRIGIDEDDVLHAIDTASVWMLGMVAIFFIIGVLGALAFSRYLFLPLRQTIEAIDRFRVDAPFKPMRTRRSDEMGDLIRAVNQSLAKLKQNHDELALWQRQLCEAERLASVGLISAGLAHEINNPMAGIHNCATRILAAPDHVEQNLDYAALIVESADHVSAVVRSLLDFSRSNPQKRASHLLLQLVQRSLRLMAIRIKKAQIRISIDIPAGFVVWVDDDAIVQVLVNLLLNAVEASAPTQAIFIRASACTSWSRICVRDQGRGMSHAAVAQAFEPFFTTKGAGQGTGLGLAVSKMIVEDHGGTIRISSQADQGTSVWLELPLLRAGAASRDTMDTSESPGSSAVPAPPV